MNNIILCNNQDGHSFVQQYQNPHGQRYHLYEAIDQAEHFLALKMGDPLQCPQNIPQPKQALRSKACGSDCGTQPGHRSFLRFQHFSELVSSELLQFVDLQGN